MRKKIFDILYMFFRRVDPLQLLLFITFIGFLITSFWAEINSIVWNKSAHPECRLGECQKSPNGKVMTTIRDYDFPKQEIDEQKQLAPNP